MDSRKHKRWVKDEVGIPMSPLPDLRQVGDALQGRNLDCHTLRDAGPHERQQLASLEIRPCFVVRGTAINIRTRSATARAVS